MSMLQVSSGVAALAAAGAIAVKAILPGPAPIQVHELRFEAGIVYQDRTVTTNGEAFFAQWAARVEDAETGDVVPWCVGSGAWPYEPGRRSVSLPLPEWVGNDACTADSLPPGLYVPVAVWSWGDDQTSHRGLAFEVM